MREVHLPVYASLCMREVHLPGYPPYHPFHCWASLRTSPVLRLLTVMRRIQELFPRVTGMLVLGVEYPFHCWSTVILPVSARFTPFGEVYARQGAV